MFLVPGIAMTATVRDALDGDLLAAVVRGAEAFGAALAIAAGVAGICCWEADCHR